MTNLVYKPEKKVVMILKRFSHQERFVIKPEELPNTGSQKDSCGVCNWALLEWGRSVPRFKEYCTATEKIFCKHETLSTES